MAHNTQKTATPWSELETRHIEHDDWPQWRVADEGQGCGPEVELRVPMRSGDVAVTMTRLDVKAMLADLTGDDDDRVQVAEIESARGEYDRMKAERDALRAALQSIADAESMCRGKSCPCGCFEVLVDIADRALLASKDGAS